VFVANLSTGGSGLFLASTGTITKIIASGDAFPDGGVFSFASGPSINDAGQIAFGGISNGSAKDGGVFLFSAGNLTVLVPRTTALPNGRDFDSAISTSLNNAGQIAFAGYSESPLGSGFFLFSNGGLTQVAASGEASPDGDIFSLGIRLSAQINSSGQILLLSSMTHHNDTLYLYASGHLTRVAGQGDTVDRRPRFLYPGALAIGTGDSVLVGDQYGADSTFPGGVGYYLASPGLLGKNTSLVANIGDPLGNGVVTYAPAAAMNRSGQVAMAVSDGSTAVFLARARTAHTAAEVSSDLIGTHPLALSSSAIDQLKAKYERLAEERRKLAERHTAPEMTPNIVAPYL
jgi:hypothetical protein